MGVVARKVPLIGGPLCGGTILHVKPYIRVRLRAGAEPLVALYKFELDGYYYQFTKVAIEVPQSTETENRAAELDHMETPPKWEGAPWTLWKLK